MRGFRGRRTKREEISALNATDRFYAAMAGVPPRSQRELPKQRAARKPSGKPLERHVLAAIIAALRWHPLVARVERNQSGVFRDGERYVRVGTVGMPDLTVYLTGGQWGKIEVKRPGGKPNANQERALNDARAAGGFAGCATSAEEAIAIIEHASGSCRTSR